MESENGKENYFICGMLGWGEGMAKKCRKKNENQEQRHQFIVHYSEVSELFSLAHEQSKNFDICFTGKYDGMFVSFKVMFSFIMKSVRIDNNPSWGHLFASAHYFLNELRKVDQLP